LPVYKTSYDFLLAIFELTKHFDREFKYTLGEDLICPLFILPLPSFNGMIEINK